MMKKKLIAVVCAAVLGILAGTPALAATTAQTTKEDYVAANTKQKTYYTSVYEPYYHQYNQYLDDLSEKVRNEQSLDQLKKIYNLLTQLVKERRAFYGDRVTPGTSRYEVPKAREAMYDAADNREDYASAVSYCAQLLELVQKRVNFMTDAVGRIDDLVGGTQKPEEPAVPVSATIVFQVRDSDKWSSSNFGFQIIVNNPTNQPITIDTLTFHASGFRISNVYALAGGAASCTQNQGIVTISPANQFQLGFTVPAGGKTILEGAASGNYADANIDVGVINGYKASTSVVK